MVAPPGPPRAGFFNFFSRSLFTIYLFCYVKFIEFIIRRSSDGWSSDGYELEFCFCRLFVNWDLTCSSYVRVLI